MNDTRSIRSFFRIIWAIARKDIIDAIKNKTVLSVLGSVAFTVAMYKFLPYLDRGEELPNLLLYDAGASAITTQLEESPQLRLYTYDSLDQMQRAVTRADRLEIGLVFPADLDRRLETGETVALDAHGVLVGGLRVDPGAQGGRDAVVGILGHLDGVAQLRAEAVGKGAVGDGGAGEVFVEEPAGGGPSVDLGGQQAHLPTCRTDAGVDGGELGGQPTVDRLG